MRVKQHRAEQKESCSTRAGEVPDAPKEGPVIPSQRERELIKNSASVHPCCCSHPSEEPQGGQDINLLQYSSSLETASQNVERHLRFVAFLQLRPLKSGGLCFFFKRQNKRPP